MSATVTGSKQCPVCLETFRRKRYENPKRWAEKTCCGSKCGNEHRKPIPIGIIRPGGLSILEISIVTNLDRALVKDIYERAVAKYKRGMAKHVRIRET